MVRSYRSPSMRISRKDITVYAPKASCLVLTPSERMDFAQFCFILLSAEQNTKIKAATQKAKEEDPNSIESPQKKGSLNRESFLLNYFFKTLYKI